MSRQRVRRSFTVEVKSSTRQGASITIPSRIRAASRPEAAAPPSSLWDVFAPPPSNGPPPAESPRVLPSLLVADMPASEDEAGPATAGEPPLPRVRRVKRVGRPPNRKPEPAETAVHPISETVAAAEPTPLPRMPLPRASEPARPDKRRLGEAQSLRRGERWKRRLPRSCW